jgi:hypothetical protein
MRRWVVLALLLLVVIPALGCAAWIYGALRYSYSEGQRTGYVQKISHKGWLCKTWEGELAMVTQPGVVPQIFAFSVRDDAVAQKILAAGGQRMSLNYAQHRGLPTTCFGETEYFITSVQAVAP